MLFQHLLKYGHFHAIHGTYLSKFQYEYQPLLSLLFQQTFYCHLTLFQQFQLELDRLSAEVANGSTGVDGLFRFVDSDYLPEPGRTISVALTLPELSEVIALPPVALYGTDRIYRVTDSRLEAVTVNHLGYRTNSNDQREILIKSDQLNAGDKIITTQLPNAVSGMLVEVKQ